MERRLRANSNLHDGMKSVIQGYLTADPPQARKLTHDEANTRTKRTWYLPVHPVTNLNKPGKIRVVNDAAAECLEKSVPRTKLVSRDEAAELWRTRRQLFFKPVAGHGSKGVYRGSKLTRRVFENILDEDYIAQSFVPAGERSIKIDDTVTTRKVDIRLYTYDGQLLLPAARVYQGQVTNFRMPGGGFVLVFQV